jgi:RNA polymerase sigma-70 factor (ECF subfamily)
MKATSGNRAAEAFHCRSLNGGVLQAQVGRGRAKGRDMREQASDAAVQREADSSTGKQHSVRELFEATVKRMKSNAQRKKESELIVAILAGDAQLYPQLISPYERSVYVMALFYMRNDKDAEDVAQETFIKAYQDLWAFQSDSAFGAWLIGIALNEAKNRLPKQVAIQIASIDQPHSEEMPATPALVRTWRELPSEIIEREEIRALLRRAVEILLDSEQQIFFLHDVEKFSASDVARILNTNASTVKVSLHQARMTLQRFLAPKLNPLDSTSAHRDDLIIDIRQCRKSVATSSAGD